MPPVVAKAPPPLAPPPPPPLASLPPYQVSPACHRDVPALVHIFLAASRLSRDSEQASDDDDAGEREGWARALSEHMADASVCLLKLTTNCPSGGGGGAGSDSILGWALWSLALSPPSSPEDDSGSWSGPGSSESESVLSSAPGSDWDEESQDSEDMYTAARGLETPPPGQPRDRRHRHHRHHQRRVCPDGPAQPWPSRAQQHHTAGPIHWHLHVLAIAPEHQAHGVVEAQLLESILVLADEAEAGVSVELMSPAEAPIYRGFGFREEGLSCQASGGGVGLDSARVLMVRRPDVRERLKAGVGRGYY